LATWAHLGLEREPQHTPAQVATSLAPFCKWSASFGANSPFAPLRLLPKRNVPEIIVTTSGFGVGATIGLAHAASCQKHAASTELLR